MTGQEYQELGRAVALALGFGWEYQPPRLRDEREPLPTYADIKQADGSGVRLTKDWNGNGTRISVHGIWPDPIEDMDGRPQHFHPQDPHTPAPSINCSVARGPVAIAADIRRRFLPDYLPLYAERAEVKARTLAGQDARRQAYAELARAAGLPVPERDRLSINYNDKGPWGHIELSIYLGEVDGVIEVRNVPLDKLIEIVKVLRS